MTDDQTEDDGAGVSAAIQPCRRDVCHAIEAVVLGADDKPVADVAVELLDDAGQCLRSRTCPRGMVRFEGLAAGDYRLVLADLDEQAWQLLSDEPLPRPDAGATPAWQPCTPEAQPVRRHTVAAGESTVGLCERYGMSPHATWSDPRNAALKARRRDMNALLPGDTLVIPALRRSSIAAAPDTRYWLRRKGIPAIYRMQVLKDGRPVSNCPYLLTIDDGAVVLQGRSDDRGTIRAWVPAQSRQGVLEMKAGPHRPALRLELRFGHVHPVDEDSGVARRLANLGLLPPDVAAASPERIRRGILMFQRLHGLRLTGAADQDTRDELFRQYDHRT